MITLATVNVGTHSYFERLIKMTMPWNLVADIGGTNARFSVVNHGELCDSIDLHYSVEDYSEFYQVIELVIDQLREFYGLANAPDQVCFAVACPADSEQITFSNSHWEFFRKDLKRKFNCSELHIINDFEALAHGVTELSSKDLLSIGNGSENPHKPKAILGAGTGLGVSALVPNRRGYEIITGEGGHADFAPVTDLQIEVLRHLLGSYRRVSFERLLSGKGLLNIYAAISELNGVCNSLDQPSQVVGNAVEGSDQIAIQTLELFCEVMGSMAGNLALTYGAGGGVYVAGGIVPRFEQFFINSRFRHFFENKGRFSEYLKSIPTYLASRPDLGLIGAAKSLILNQE